MSNTYDSLVKALLSVQQVNKYSREHDNMVHYLQRRLPEYAEVFERLNTASIKDMKVLQGSVLYSIVANMYFLFLF